MKNKKRSKKKQQIQNIVAFIAITMTLSIANPSSLVYASELAKGNNKALINSDTKEKVENEKSEKTNILDNWEYNEDYSKITLIKYNGLDKNIVIPGEIKGKQVELVKFDKTIFPSSMTSLQIKAENGKKVKLNVTNLRNAFRGLTSLVTADFNGLDTSNITNMQSMFQDCNKLTSLDLSTWNTSNVTNMQSMFYGCSSLETLNVSGLTVKDSIVDYTTFYGCTALKNVTLRNFTGAQFVKELLSNNYELEQIDLTNWNTGDETNFGHLFKKHQNLRTVILKNWNTSKVTVMNSMFSECPKLVTVNTDNWDTSNAINMSYMFYGCSSLTNLNLSTWNTSNVTNMQIMFYGCSSLTNLDLSTWNTSNVTSMRSMFYGCSSLTNLNLSTWNTSNITNMRSMFYGCSSLTNLDLSTWNTSNVTDMQFMFASCGSLETLNASGWTVKDSIVDYTTFYGCTALKNVMLRNFTGAQFIKEIVSKNSGIEQLDLSNSHVRDIELLRGLTNLTNLNLNNNQIGNIEPLRGLTNLTNLNLNNNQISNIEPLRGLTNLINLNLNNNQIGNIEPLRGLTNLTSLDLENQNIMGKEVTTLSNTATFNNKIVNVNGNPVPITNGQDYTYNSYNNTIKFSNISSSGNKSYSFSTEIVYGNNKTALFNGTVTHKVTYDSNILGYISIPKGVTLKNNADSNNAEGTVNIGLSSEINNSINVKVSPVLKLKYETDVVNVDILKGHDKISSTGEVGTLNNKNRNLELLLSVNKNAFRFENTIYYGTLVFTFDVK